MTRVLAHTALYDWHVAQGGRMVDFAGWEMPVQYASIIVEHHATRRGVTLFDVSHMGRFRLDGAGAADFLDRLVTRRVKDLGAGRIRYALITNQHGGILDDVLVYHLIDTSGRPFQGMVVNAGNREKIVTWIDQHLLPGEDVTFTDQTQQTAMIAVQGPRAGETAQPLFDFSLADMRYYTGRVCRWADGEAIVSRTGYTGEDGFELIVPANAAREVWESLMSAGRDYGIMPAGLGARDTLRLEAALPLYGHELSEDINPLQAGLEFAINLAEREFPGREALVQQSNNADQLRRVGLRLEGKRVARQHYAISSHGRAAGEVTSGTFSPTLQYPIAMGYVPSDLAELGTELSVDIRGRPTPAQVVPLPFYKRTSQGKI